MVVEERDFQLTEELSHIRPLNHLIAFNKCVI